MTLNGVMAVALRYFTEFGKPVFQHITVSTSGGIYAADFLHSSEVRFYTENGRFAFLSPFGWLRGDVR